MSVSDATCLSLTFHVKFDAPGSHRHRHPNQLHVSAVAFTLLSQPLNFLSCSHPILNETQMAFLSNYETLMAWLSNWVAPEMVYHIYCSGNGLVCSSWARDGLVCTPLCLKWPWVLRQKWPVGTTDINFVAKWTRIEARIPKCDVKLSLKDVSVTIIGNFTSRSSDRDIFLVLIKL